MDDKHPHDGATYTILRNDDGTFGVEVKIPGANPITISGLEGEAGAEKWIARHKETVAKGKPRRAFTRPKRHIGVPTCAYRRAGPVSPPLGCHPGESRGP